MGATVDEKLHRCWTAPALENIRPLSAPSYHALMMARDQLLDVLEQLPLWHWPVFFWELVWFELYVKARIEAGEFGLVGVGVGPDGRIHIIMDARTDAVKDDWTAHAPRAPWDRLAPGAALAALPAAALGLAFILAAPLAANAPHGAPHLALPPFLDSG